MQYIITLIFIVVFILFDNSLGYTVSSPIYTHFTYMFQHASVLHLAFNSIAFIGLYRALSKLDRYLLPVIVIIAVLCSFAGVYALPTVGASGMNYAMIGMFIIQKDKFNIKKKDFYIFLGSVAVMLVISIFKQNSNYILHLSCLAYGAAYSIIKNV